MNDDIAGGPDTVRDLVEGLADRLGRSVVVNDPLVRPLYGSRHFGDADPVRIRALLEHHPGPEAVEHVLASGVTRWSRPGRIPGNPALEMVARFCVPLRARGEFVGTMMVIDADETLTEPEMADIEGVAAVVAAHLVARGIAADTRARHREDVLRGLLGTDGARRAEAGVRARELGFTDVGPTVLVAVHARSDGHDRAQVELALRTGIQPLDRIAAVGPGLGVVDDHGATVAQQWRGPVNLDEVRAQGTRVVARVRGALGRGAEVAIGIAGPGSGLDAVPQLADQARYAVRAARTLPDLAGIAVWSELGAYAALLAIPDGVSAATPAAAALVALDSSDAGPRLRHTLRTYLDNAGDVARTAKALALHRTSLYYRLRQIHDITGMDLHSGTDRLALHIQLLAEDIA